MIEYRWRNPDTGKDYSYSTFIDLLEGMKKHGYRSGKFRVYEDGKIQRIDTVE